ncbi:MAG: LysR family transcriptional regulator [Verrucomicrobiota bacterium]
MKRTKASALSPKLKLWLSTPATEGVFGDGKWRLLRAIDKTRSLSAAAKSLDISYRKAWGDLQKAERCLGIRLSERTRGGMAGGSTRLTGAGRIWMEAYSRFRSRVEQAVAQAYRMHLQIRPGDRAPLSTLCMRNRDKKQECFRPKRTRRGGNHG